MTEKQSSDWIERRGLGFMIEVAILALGVSIAAWQEVATIFMIAGIAAWVALSIHRSFGSVLSELYELNDQIAGRRDEFRRIVQERASEPLS